MGNGITDRNIWRWQDVFYDKPTTWGLRGDPYVWQALLGLMESKPMPEDSSVAVSQLQLGFEAITGWRLDAKDRPSQIMTEFEFEHGGMSNGQCSLDVWQTRLMPLLVRRVRASFKRVPQKLANDYATFATRLMPFGLAIVSKQELLRTSDFTSYQRSQVLASISDDLRKASDITIEDLRPAFVSFAAGRFSDELGAKLELSRTPWHRQPSFDPGRKNLMFEHLDPINQIRSRLFSLTSAEEVIELLWRELRVTWITKEENERLTRGGFSRARENPMYAYAKCGILLDVSS